MENLKKYLGVLVVLTALAIFGLVCNCSDSVADVAKGEKIQLKKQLAEADKKVLDTQKASKLFRDSIKKEYAKKDSEIARINNLNTTLLKKIANRNTELKKKKDVVKTYSFKQSADFIAIRYDRKEAVSFNDSSLVLKSNVPNLIVAELIEKDVLEVNLVESDSIITNQKQEVKLLGEKVVGKDLELGKVTEENKALQEVVIVSKEVNKKSEKEIRQLKNKNLINKFVIVIVAVGGFLLGGL